MKSFLQKLNYKGQQRIAVLKTDKEAFPYNNNGLENLIVDNEIDLRFPYDFMIIFVKEVAEIEHYAPIALHNLVADGILWFCYPKKNSKGRNSLIDRDHGWKALNDLNFYGIRNIAIDNDWSAIRFRNKKYIRSSSRSLKK
jgi:hypothetical protein